MRRVHRFFTTNLPYKALSVLIALALWFIVRDERVETTVNLGLEVQAPGELLVTNEHLPDLTVAVTGTRVALSRLRSANFVHVVKPKVAEPGPVTLRIRPEDLDLPAGVDAVGVSPSSVGIRLEARAVRRIPVKARILLAEGTGFRVKKVVVTPERVRIAGPASVVAGLDEVWTEAIDVEPQGSEPLTGDYAVSLPHRQLRLEDPGPVSVRIELEPEPAAPVPVATPAGLKVKGRSGSASGLADAR